jgi:hypothetical protein
MHSKLKAWVGFDPPPPTLSENNDYGYTHRALNAGITAPFCKSTIKLLSPSMSTGCAAPVGGKIIKNAGGHSCSRILKYLVV